MNDITFHSGEPLTRIMTISQDGIWVNPDIPADEVAQRVIAALDDNIKAMVAAAVEREREVIRSIKQEAETGLVIGDEIGMSYALEQILRYSDEHFGIEVRK